MKPFVVLLFALIGSLKAEPTFLGVLDAGKNGRFFAVASSEGSTSKWLTVGGSIDGYTVIGYKDREEQLILRKGGADLLLTLRKPRVRDARPFVDEVSVRDLAKQIIAKWDGWDLATTEIIVWYKSDWNVVATRIVDGKKENRIISVPDGFALSVPR